MKKQNNLKGTRCYLAGPMEFADGKQWRIEVCQKLNSLGVVCLNPYEDFFVGKIPEDGLMENVQLLRDKELYYDLDRIASNVRKFDLAAVAKSDFIIAYINTNTFCFGTIEEIVTAQLLNKPIFVLVEQGKSKAPFWLFGLIGSNNIYSLFDQIFEDLQDLDYNLEGMSIDKWSLLLPEIR